MNHDGDGNRTLTRLRRILSVVAALSITVGACNGNSAGVDQSVPPAPSTTTSTSSSTSAATPPSTSADATCEDFNRVLLESTMRVIIDTVAM